MGPAMFVYSEGRLFTPDHRDARELPGPARPGPLYGEGQVVQAGKSIAFLEGKLMDLSGTVVARATASARLVPAAKALAAQIRLISAPSASSTKASGMCRLRQRSWASRPSRRPGRG